MTAPPALQPQTALARVPFHDGVILCVKDARGEWVVLKPLCDRLRLDHNAQVQRLKRQGWAKGHTCKTVVDGLSSQVGNARFFCLHRRRLAMWLATIEVSRTAKADRPFLNRLQNEAADVLDAYFLGGGVSPPEGETLRQELAAQAAQLAALQQELAALRAQVAARPSRPQRVRATPAPAPHPLRVRVLATLLGMQREALKARITRHPSLRALGPQDLIRGQWGWYFLDEVRAWFDRDLPRLRRLLLGRWTPAEVEHYFATYAEELAAPVRRPPAPEEKAA